MQEILLVTLTFPMVAKLWKDMSSTYSINVLFMFSLVRSFILIHVSTSSKHFLVQRLKYHIPAHWLYDRNSVCLGGHRWKLRKTFLGFQWWKQNSIQSLLLQHLMGRLSVLVLPDGRIFRWQNVTVIFSSRSISISSFIEIIV